MVKFVHKFEVISPITDVFDLISDIANYNQWVPSSSMVFIDTTITSANRKGIGLTFVDRVRFGGKTVGKVVEYDPPSLFTIKQKTSYVVPYFDANISYQLGFYNNITQVTHTMTAKTIGIFILVTPILERFIAKERIATCNQIVHKLEKEI